MPEQELRGLLGLAKRAGQMMIGAGRALEQVRLGKVPVLFLDEAASDNTKKRFIDACQSHQVSYKVLTPGFLGQAIGKPGTMVAAVLPGGIATKIKLACQDINIDIQE